MLSFKFNDGKFKYEICIYFTEKLTVLTWLAYEWLFANQR